MPRIENVTNRRVIVRERALQGNPARVTLADVRMPRKGNLDDLRSDEPHVLDAYQKSVLADIKAIKTLDRFVNSRPAASLRPRLIRPMVAPIATTSDAGRPDARIEEPKAPRVRSIYDRHGLTSRGRKLPAGTFQPEPERIIPGATVYAALPPQGAQFYRVRVKE